MVKLNHPSLTAFPKLQQRIRERLPATERDRHTVWQCFLDSSKLPAVFARDVVSGRIGSPTLVVEALDRILSGGPIRINGMFQPGTPDQIYLCDDIARMGETPLGDDPRYWRVVESTVLHELVHWADFRDGSLETSIELGKKFEEAAYGVDIGRFWSPGEPAACGMASACATLVTGGALDMDAPEPVGDAPFAAPTRGLWPVVTLEPDRLLVSYRTIGGRQIGRAERSFFAMREARSSESLGSDRHHVGVDLFGRPGDLVRACEEGEIVGIQNFYQGTMAMLVLGASGIVVNYGEIAAGSWGTLRVGSRVGAGQAIAQLGRSSRGGMLHFETYTGGTRATSRWIWGQPRPTNILNPTRYLLALQP